MFLHPGAVGECTSFPDFVVYLHVMEYNYSWKSRLIDTGAGRMLLAVTSQSTYSEGTNI